MYSLDFGTGEFQYANRIFKGAKRVVTATKFKQKSQNCTDFRSAQKIEDFSARIVRFSVAVNSNMLSKITREPRELPMQLNLDNISHMLITGKNNLSTSITSSQLRTEKQSTITTSLDWNTGSKLATCDTGHILRNFYNCTNPPSHPLPPPSLPPLLSFAPSPSLPSA